MFPPPGPGMPGAAAGPPIPASGGFGPAPRPGTGIIPADYIRVLSEWLRLPVTTTSSALVYFYRFDRYRKAHSQSAHAHGLKTADTLLFATACVYLATKTTDCNRKIRDVLNCAHSALRPDEPPMRIDTAHWKFRESLLAAELVLLRILKFELNVDLAYWPAIQYVRHLFRVHPAPPPTPPMPPPPAAPPSSRGRSRSRSRPRDAGARVRRSNRMSPPPPLPNAARRRARSWSRSRSRDRVRDRDRDRDRDRYGGSARRSPSPRSRRGSRNDRDRERDRRRSSRSRSPAGTARRRSRSRSPPPPPGGRRSRSPPPGGRRRSRSPLPPPHARVRRTLSPPPPPPPPSWAPPPARFVVADMADQYQLPSITDVPPAARFVLQTAWGFVADAYLRSSVLDWAAHDIALAAVAVALALANADQAPDVDRLCAAFRRPAGPVHKVVKWIVNTHELKPARTSAGGGVARSSGGSRRSLTAAASAASVGGGEEPVVGMTSAPSS